jgi:hypothetical protein
MKTFDLDTPLIEFPSQSGTNYFTIRNAVEGLGVWGGIGAGKSTGSGRLLALRYLTAGFGGLVMTAKPDELQVWKDYCRMTGREKDLVVIEPGGATFNFLQYELSHGASGLTPTGNLVEVLNTVIAAGAAKDSGRSDDGFWQSSLDTLIHFTIDLCKLASGRVRVQDLYDIIASMPKEGRDRNSQSEPNNAFDRAFQAARLNVTKQIDTWQATLEDEEIRRLEDDVAYEEALSDAVNDARLLKFIDGFYYDTLFHMGDKTRSIIELMFSSFLLRLLWEPFYSLFCRYPSTVTPEDCLNGKIIVVNLPVKTYQKSGRDAQLLVKYCFQRAWERRNVDRNPRPVFLWADEAQLFIHEKDADFQATARSSRVATVYLSQNLPNYMASMGGAKPEFKVKSFLGTLGTKIFHANVDHDTNTYSSALIGDGFYIDKTGSTTVGKDFAETFGKSFKLERMVRPEAFVSLMTGGKLNDMRVEAYMHRQGAPFSNGFNHMKVTFSQQAKR